MGWYTGVNWGERGRMMVNTYWYCFSPQFTLVRPISFWIALLHPWFILVHPSSSRASKKNTLPVSRLAFLCLLLFPTKYNIEPPVWFGEWKPLTQIYTDDVRPTYMWPIDLTRKWALLSLLHQISIVVPEKNAVNKVSCHYWNHLCCSNYFWFF